MANTKISIVMDMWTEKGNDGVTYDKVASAIASKYIKMTKTSHDPKAKYYSGKAVGGHTYYLAAAGQAIPNDEFLGNTSFIVQGRWTP